MPSGKDEKEAKLRVVEEVTHSEEVLRLGENEVEEVARVEVAPPPELTTRLATEEAEFERRTHEPDIDVIIDDARESEDLEDDWQETSTRGPVPYGWFVLIFLAIGGAVAWSAGWFSDEPEVVPADLARQESVERMAEDEAEIREATELVEMVEARVRQYADADSWEGMLPHVRDRSRVEPLMRRWYREEDFEPMPFGRLLVFQPLELDARNFFIVRYEVKKSNEAKSLLVEDCGDEGVFVDWETDVCYQPMPWDRYVEERPEGVLQFRVQVEPDYAGLYSHEFQDESRWLAIRLTALDSDEFLVGYVERRGKVEEEIRTLIEDNQYRPVSVVLRLRVPANVKSLRGVVIEEVVSNRWLIQEEK
ncbi:hypothetical protein [Haloferula rosea]|uniref:Uncharacterized protein n=1 Tax=Haloferula rosea TaxID=490093 RepID=A0A934R8P7_9BACT|nr:hypothetical protein [Haloferula rosea]MBK1826013.1 hypothetical protein [Haloferula rosea]